MTNATPSVDTSKNRIAKARKRRNEVEKLVFSLNESDETRKEVASTLYDTKEIIETLSLELSKEKKRNQQNVDDAMAAAAASAWDRDDMARRMEGVCLELAVSQRDLHTALSEISEDKKTRRMWLTGTNSPNWLREGILTLTLTLISD